MGRAAEIAAALNASMGAGTVLLGSDPALSVVLWPTHITPFDVILGGGLPAGRSVELFGGFSVLKSYLALASIAAVQQAGGTAAIVDTEHAYDPDWAESLGVDIGELIVQHPPNGEEAVKLTTTLVKNEVDLVVWDSVAATLPKAYEEATPGESGDNQPARLATLMSKGLQRMNAANKKTCLLFINQTRTNLGITFGSKESTPGGKALGYYASLRVRLTRAGKITRDVKTWDGDKRINTKEVTGYKIKAELDKSKLNRPHREVWFEYKLGPNTDDEHGGGIDVVGFLIAQGIEQGVIEEQGKGYWTIPEIMDGKLHGKAKLRRWIEEEEVVDWLAERIMESHLSIPGE